jgi:hypothetical protein
MNSPFEDDTTWQQKEESAVAPEQRAQQDVVARFLQGNTEVFSEILIQYIAILP